MAAEIEPEQQQPPSASSDSDTNTKPVTVSAASDSGVPWEYEIIFLRSSPVENLDWGMWEDYIPDNWLQRRAGGEPYVLLSPSYDESQMPPPL